MKKSQLFVFLFLMSEMTFAGTWLAHYYSITDNQEMCQVTGKVYSSIRTNFGAVCSTVEHNSYFSGDHKCDQNQLIIFTEDIVAIARGYAYPPPETWTARFHGISNGDATPSTYDHDTWKIISCKDCYANFKSRVIVGECIDTLCPIVIDTAKNGFTFGGAENRVSFAMWPYDGFQVMNWVTPKSDDAFLALDLNGNGAIDDGTELFGNGTLLYLENRTAENGFIAMAQYDRFALGGNEDGRLSPEDQVWPELSIWLDSNADGVTDPGELSAIIDSGLMEISLVTAESQKVDAHLNWWRFPGRAKVHTPKGKPGVVRILDVFFKRYPYEEF